MLMVAGAAMDDSRPAGFPWSYDRGEIIADGVIHAIGICLGLIGVVVIIALAAQSTKNVAIASVLIYAAGLAAI
jgi:hemolysin III